MSTNDTEPITYRDALKASRILAACANDTADVLELVAGGRGTTTHLDAVHLRAAADYMDAHGKHETPSILRRAADQIDPSTVPAEPDLTTRAGWEATMAALGDVEWEDMPIPSCREQRVGLLAAWKIADLSGHDKDAVLLAQVFTASLADEV